MGLGQSLALHKGIFPRGRSRAVVAALAFGLERKCFALHTYRSKEISNSPYHLFHLAEPKNHSFAHIALFREDRETPTGILHTSGLSV